MKLIVNGGKKLAGTLKCQGSKNCGLSLIGAASILSSQCNISNIPNVTDLLNLLSCIEYLGGDTAYDVETNSAVVHLEQIKTSEIPIKYCMEGRGVLYLLPIVLKLKGEVVFYTAGGCDLGRRAIDIHLDGLASLGCRITEAGNKVTIECDLLRGGYYRLPFQSNMATANLLAAAALAEGETVLENICLNPEVIGRISFLKAAGADISLIGANKICVVGGKTLHLTSFKNIPDRVVLGTLTALSALYEGDLQVEGGNFSDIQKEIDVLSSVGINKHEEKNKDSYFTLSKYNPKLPFIIETGPYPEFCTDIQPVFSILGVNFVDKTIIVEKMFDDRFNYLGELEKFGVVSHISNSEFLLPSGRHAKKAIIEGRGEYYGAKVRAPDLRGGAALLLMALITKGKSEIEKYEYIDRGYDALIEQLIDCGADISLCS